MSTPSATKTDLGGAYILVVDDNPEILFTVETLLSTSGAEVGTATNGKEAISSAKSRAPELIVMDVMMPVLSGIEATKEIKADPELRRIPVLLLSSKDELSDISLGASAGAEDYMRKPFDSEELLSRVQSALHLGSLYREVKSLREDRNSSSDALDVILGKSSALQEVLDAVLRMQDSHAPVLVRGESGVGKELFARAVHDKSPRREAPFVVQNCSALHENLLESELFGHVRGAFTGAVRDKQGLFEQANSGTLFLDELGEMSLPLQAKLLRVIQYGTFTPVGATEEKKVDVRIIGATHRPLEEMVSEGTFREDLLYRLNVLSLSLPPLRERSDDIPLLAQHFLSSSCAAQGKPLKNLTEEVLMLMQSYSWPGNIRELENEIERMVTMSGLSTILGAGYLSPQILGADEKQKREEAMDGAELPSFLFSGTLRDAITYVEEKLLAHAMKEYKGNKSEVARQLGISRSNLIAKVQAYKIED